MILFFTYGVVPEKEERELAISKGAKIRSFKADRNMDDDNIEKCSAVYGYYPNRYEGFANDEAKKYKLDMAEALKNPKKSKKG